MKIKVSKKKKFQKKTKKVEHKRVVEQSVVKIEDIPIPVPSGRWRLGLPCQGTKAILLRYAHFKDKLTGNSQSGGETKHPGSTRVSVKGRESMKAAQRRRQQERSILLVDDPPREQLVMETRNDPWGALAQSWGSKKGQDQVLSYQDLLRKHVNPGSFERKRKRAYSFDDEDDGYVEADYLDHEDESYRRRPDSEEDINWRSTTKKPRMRMYADVEEKKHKKRRATPSDDLRYTLSGRSGNQRSCGIRDRLSGRYSKHSSSNRIDSRRDVAPTDLRYKISERRRIASNHGRFY